MTFRQIWLWRETRRLQFGWAFPSRLKLPAHSLCLSWSADAKSGPMRWGGGLLATMQFRGKLLSVTLADHTGVLRVDLVLTARL